MARRTRLADYGVEDTDDFGQGLDRLFDSMFSNLSRDDLLLRPREALRFCDEARASFQNFDVPDELILRTVLARRAESEPARPLAS